MPRATVLTTGVRALLPSVKNALASSGSYRGASCMSCLHAAAAHATTTITSACISELRRNFRHSHWMEAIEKLSRRVAIEPRICGLDAQEESIHRCACECRRIEDRVVRLGKSVHRPHADKRRQRRAKNSRFE